MTRLLPWILALAMMVYYATPLIRPGVRGDPLTSALVIVPPLLGLLLLGLRHRAPVPAVIAVGVLLFLGPGVAGVAAAMTASVARHRRSLTEVIATIGWFAAVKTAALTVGPLSTPWDQTASVEWVITLAVITTAALAGLLFRSRDEIDVERANTARALQQAQEARIQQARAEEREAIAREMHDVLAHRISLIALHAGALAHREDVGGDQARESAQLIRDSARRSLEELRMVLSSLRGTGGPHPEPPQPALADVRVLVAEVSESQPVELDLGLDPTVVPDSLSRHAFRMIQEALTNACKHAPHAPVRVRIDGRPGGELEITVQNPLTPLAPPDRTGSGLGLVGIAERATGLHGRAEHTRTDTDFTVHILLPWRMTA